MLISQEAFQAAFELFKKKVLMTSGGIAFKSFHEGLPAEWESYKPPLRAKALEIMSADNWRPEQVGSGDILRSVIRAIEINEPGMRNNLVSWINKFGHSNRSHHKLLDALDDTNTGTQFENLFRDLYQGGSSEKELFEELLGLAGKRYDLLAYLFFLKDSERFMPIAPTRFDDAFDRLGLDLVTAHKCSWENYCLYNDALDEVRSTLIEQAGIEDVRLIDAHSFCWILVMASEDDDGSAGQSPKRIGPERDKGRVLDPWGIAAMEMVKSIKQTVKSSGGPPVEKTPKRKELKLSDMELEKYLITLMEKQDYRCALTGIPLQTSGEHTDDALLRSPDRIDSNGHYEAGNLQLVCKFINQWKSDEDDEEFRRLLSLVRGNDD